MLDQSLLALQNSAFANWVQQSAYPVVITFHSIGLATLVGLLVVIDLRVLGFVKALPLAALRQLMTVVWVGFWINAASGLMLFSIDAKKDFYSGLFRTKLFCIAAGLLLGSIINSQAMTPRPAADAIDASPQLKTLAALSLLCWVSAIISGRLLAYFTFGDVGIE